MSEYNPAVVELTASIVAAYVAHNNVPAGDLAGLIASTHTALSKLGAVLEPPPAEPLVPAVPIKKSVTDEAIISLENGRPFKSLKRHLAGLSMTPDQYRAKWGLPYDYPMTAPAYSERRSALAKAIGLGRKAAVAPAPAKAKPAPEPEKARAKRGRPAKAKE